MPTVTSLLSELLQIADQRRLAPIRKETTEPFFKDFNSISQWETDIQLLLFNESGRFRIRRVKMLDLIEESKTAAL